MPTILQPSCRRKTSWLVQDYLFLTNPSDDSLLSRQLQAAGWTQHTAEKAEPGGIQCDYMKPKSLHGQVISRFKKALQETAMSDVYRSCSLSDGRSGTRRPQEPGEETDIEHHKL